MDDRKKALEEFAKRLSTGDSSSRDFVPSNLSQGKQALQARNLVEEALAHQLIKNTDIKTPVKKWGSLGREESEEYIKAVLKQQYPELELNVAAGQTHLGGLDGFYQPKHKLIGVQQDPQDIRKMLATALHEAGHGYDDQKLNYEMPDVLKQGHTSQLDIKGMYDAAKKSPLEVDPTELYEIAAKGHHARIPNLRDADSFGLGALKSYMKNGTFKALPIVGPAVGAVMALGSDDASAAVPFLNEAEDVGMSASEEKEMLNEIKARQRYDKSPAANDKNHTLRQQALQRLIK